MELHWNLPTRFINFRLKYRNMQFTLSPAERLKSKKQIDWLFREGQSFFVYPFKVLYLMEHNSGKKHASIMIMVSKKKFKQAVLRNRIKRRVREAFRKNKLPLNAYLEKNNKSMLLGLIYTGETILPYQETERKLILILQRLIEQDEKTVG